MVVSLRSSLDQLAEQTPGLNVRALLLRGEWQGDKRPENPRYGRVDYLAAPAGSPFWFDLEDGFPYLLTILLEELQDEQMVAARFMKTRLGLESTGACQAG